MHNNSTKIMQMQKMIDVHENLQAILLKMAQETHPKKG